MVYNEFNVVIYYFIQMIKYVLILSGIMNFKLKKKKHVYAIGLIPVLLIIALINTEIPNQEDIIGWCMPIVYNIVIVYLLEGKLIKRLLYSIFSYVLILFADACAAGLISIILNLNMQEIVDNDLLHILTISIMIPILVIIILFMRLRRKTISSISLSYSILILLFVGISCGAFFIASQTLIGASTNARKLVMVFTIIVCIAYLAGCLMLIFITRSRDNYRALSEINQTVIEAQKNYYLLANKKQQEIRAIRHELDNHIFCIDALCKNQKYNEMQDYINQLINQTKDFQEIYITGSDIVDAILNDASGKAKDEGIIINLDGHFPAELRINTMDLCILFANAINNAIEAVRKIDDEKVVRSIKVIIKSYNEDLFIEVQNPVNEESFLSGDTLKTTKKDKLHHGFGLDNMRRITGKYEGSLRYECKDRIFYLYIYIRNL